MMKVIVVDDERNIREGIMRLIDWESYDCEVVAGCANGNAALQYLQANPVDIVVTDIKMPVMDGLELSRRIQEEFSAVKVIILTAYSDFAMAKQAIKYHVTDFIVKNDFIEELPIAIEKAVKQIKATQESEEVLAVTLDEGQIYENIFRKIILSGTVNEAEIAQYHLEDYRYCLCACDMNYYDKKQTEQEPARMLDNILKIALKECSYHILSLNTNYLLLVVRYTKESQLNRNKIVEYFNNILIMVEEFMRVDIKLGLSSQVDELRLLPQAYEEAKESLAGIMSEGCELRVYNATSFAEGKEFTVDLDQRVLKIVEATFDEEQDIAQEEIKELYDKLGNVHCAFEQCQLYMLMICSSVIHKAVRYHLDVDIDFNEMDCFVNY